MRLAIPYENGEVFQHFGHSEHFKLYDIADGRVVSSAVVDTMGSGHSALIGMLLAYQVEVLICGGIGGGARAGLEEMGIQLFGGVSGAADSAVQAYLNGALSYDPEARCTHHDHEHGEGHSCGEHGCGGHSCADHDCGGHC